MTMSSARSIRVRGVVQGVGFRPFVYRLAQANTLTGWVRNGEQGVEIHLEGPEHGLDAFIQDLLANPPGAARIAEIEIETVNSLGIDQFTIRESRRRERPTARISPDLPICEACLAELFDPADRRYEYPYINCTACGPRYSVILALPYDRPNTTMKNWRLDDYCSAEYKNPDNRRFHAQPVACPECGPGYFLEENGAAVRGSGDAIRRAAQLLNSGSIVAVKGLGGYHLGCDATNAAAVAALRERKYRKEKPFALMVKDLELVRNLVELSDEAEELLTSSARPILLAGARTELSGISPDNHEFGVMLPYAPLHYLLFAAGAPEILVMTSANRSSEPIAYEDDEARQRLVGIADALLIGERPIARRVEDSVARAGTFGPVVLRRSRGYAPEAVAKLPAERPILALGADLKNTITLVVDGQAFVSQHIGDLEHYQSLRAFEETIRDLVAMYDVCWQDLTLVHDCHPQYFSTTRALEMTARSRHTVQHHRAHMASVLAERGEWTAPMLGVSLDGTGYGDDGSIWGGEFFAGSVTKGFERIAHLRHAALLGGDAAAHHPVQAAAGFLAQIETAPDFTAAPFEFGRRYREAQLLVQKKIRLFDTTSVGRLFDTAAALIGFTRAVTFEGQAAMWLEQLARTVTSSVAYPFPFDGEELDFRPLLQAIVRDRLRGQPAADIARAFQLGLAQGVTDAIRSLCRTRSLDGVVLSGGVFQNELLLEDIKALLGDRLKVWTNHAVPPNDGGISLGQAALAAFGQFNAIAQGQSS